LINRRRASFTGTKFGGGKRGRAKTCPERSQTDSFPPTPFLPVHSFNEGGPFCPPDLSAEVLTQAGQPGFCSKGGQLTIESCPY